MKAVLFSAMVLTSALLGSLQAQADVDVFGKTLQCHVDRKNLGSENITYKFFRTPSHLAAEVKSDGGLDEIAPYSQVGTAVVVELFNGNVVNSFDVSNPQSIHSSEQYCIRPGQMGGDTRPVCVIADTSCTLF